MEGINMLGCSFIRKPKRSCISIVIKMLVTSQKILVSVVIFQRPKKYFHHMFFLQLCHINLIKPARKPKLKRLGYCCH